MTKFEEHKKAFLEIKGILEENKEYFALAKAFKKPFKWYGKHSKDEAIEILRAEARA